MGSEKETIYIQYDQFRQPWSCTILQFAHMSVSDDWFFEHKIDKHDKILFVLAGKAELETLHNGITKKLILEKGDLLLIPRHMAVSYRSVESLEKIHIYFSVL